MTLRYLRAGATVQYKTPLLNSSSEDNIAVLSDPDVDDHLLTSGQFRPDYSVKAGQP